MGIQINTGDHQSPVNGYVAVPASKRDSLNWARSRAKAIASGNPKANTFFRKMPGGRSLTQLLNDRTIWINYCSGLTLFGEAQVSGKELALGPKPFPIGKWTVLGTLIHELAHINGVPSNEGSTMAEEALYHCGLGSKAEYDTEEDAPIVDDPSTPYNPHYGN